jgi:5-methyltetrahydropteroyltriglutamate--homocysteine methyltransferase
MLTVTQNLMLPTAITGSYPRPLWFDLSLDGRSFKSALGESLFREQYLDAVAAVINAQEAAGLDIVTDGDSRFDLAVGGKSWFFYPIERITGIEGHRDTSRGWMSRHGLRPGKILWEVQEAYQPGVVKHKVGRGPLEYTAIWQMAQRMSDRPVKFGAICAPALASMLWNEFYQDDKQLVLDLCDIMNAEFREMADAGCPLIQVEEPPHHGRSLRPDCTEAELEFLTEAFNRQLAGVNAEIWVHTCWGNPNQQRVYWEGRSRPAPVRQIQDGQEDRHRRGEPLQHDRGATRLRSRPDPPRAGVHSTGASGDHHRLRLRPRGLEPAHRALQVRLDGGRHEHRAA